ncbi:hypothetical protein [Methylosinus sp. R-45379]|uniref:hypothetical protein n=1 Tax=Methylosinus sp. R-45379 TaxID=980563 RepID=UPI0004AD21DC|nr:hypothetical protein [Methylosinus sp. R-45379]
MSGLLAFGLDAAGLINLLVSEGDARDPIDDAARRESASRLGRGPATSFRRVCGA